MNTFRALSASLLLLFACRENSAGPDDTVSDIGQVFGGPMDDLGYCVQQTSDGGYVIVGETYSYGSGNSDVWLIKTDTNGNQEWVKTFGGPEYDVGVSVQETSDGGFIVTGWTSEYCFAGPSSCGDYDILLLKTDASGRQEWLKTYGGSNWDYGNSVQQTYDDGYIIAGLTYSYGAGEYDVFLIKTEDNGDMIWSRTFGGPEGDLAKSVQLTADTGFVLTGLTYSYGSGYSDVWLIKTDRFGNDQWNRTFGGSDGDYGKYVQQSSDGGYVVFGRTASFGEGDFDVLLLKADSSGDEEWKQTFGGSGWDSGNCGQETSEGGYVIVGTTESYGENGDVWLIKTDSKGKEEWSKTFHGGGKRRDYGRWVQQTIDGGYVIAGSSQSTRTGYHDLWLIKTDSEGNLP